MGGKLNLFNPIQLNRIYQNSQEFEQIAEESMQKIQIEIINLNDPSFQSGLDAKYRDQYKNMITKVTEAVDSLKTILKATNSFIENKLIGASQLANEHPLQAETQQDTEIFSVDISLKK